jgi:hypothetical protein
VRRGSRSSRSRPSDARLGIYPSVSLSSCTDVGSSGLT